jgi:hypothetical protein
LLWLNGVCFTDINNGTAVGNKGTILRTSDGGQNWISQSSGTTKYLCGVSFTDANNGTAVGENGTILRTTDGGVTFVEEESNQTEPHSFLLSQNFPNPFNPSTVISYRLPVIGFVTLKVYDILGGEIVTLVNEEKPAGDYEVEFNGINLPSGIYFYQLKAGQYSETKKMILLK